MDNDFNTALAISNLFVYFKKIKAKINSGDATCQNMLGRIKKTYSLLGLFESEPSEFIAKYKKTEEIPKNVIALAEDMQKARAVKDYATADALRAEITKAGYVVKISKDGYTVEKLK